MATLRYWDATQNQYIALPGGPATTYVQVQAPPAPNPSAPVLSPPQGALWVDTSTTAPVTPQAYFPPQTPPASGFNTFTDGAGTVWVSRAGSAWRMATTALHARYYLSANFAVTAAGNTLMNCNAASTDPMNCAGSGGFVVPLAGVYLVAASTNLSAAPAAAGAIQQIIAQNGTPVTQGGGMYYPVSSPLWPAATGTDLLVCNANDTIQSYIWSNQAVNVMGGNNGRTYLSVQYIGPTT